VRIVRDPFIVNNRAQQVPEAIATSGEPGTAGRTAVSPANAPMRSFRDLTDPPFVRDDAAGECAAELKR